jgi:MFS family permease
VIFLTLYIDLIGFSIIFPLVPNLLGHYLTVDAHSGLLGWLLGQTDRIATTLHMDSNFREVLFGGIVTSFFSILQFVFAPFWGTLSDRHGRRGVLRWTVAGTALGYLMWAVSGSFWMFLLSRVVSGAFSGNLSVATAAVADVTTREERSKAMGLVGAAFGLGLVTGPAVGGISAGWDLLKSHPGLATYGVNPFTVPALISFGLCVLNLVWISARFKETLSEGARAQALEPRLRNPIRAILMLDNAPVRRANIVAFVYALAFVAMEASLTFLAVERFHYTVAQNTKLMVFLGFCAIVTQGYIVRKMLKTMDEIRVLKLGLVSSALGLLAIGYAPAPWLLYTGLGLLALGSGLVNPSTSGLISLYATQAEQGRVLGIFRSLGSLARAITPVLAGVTFWVYGSRAVFVASAALALGALVVSVTLPKPEK